MSFFKDGLNSGKPPKEKLTKEVREARKKGIPVNCVSAIRPLPRQKGLSLTVKVEHWLASHFSRAAKA